jgi:hypothetical protein
MFFTKHQFGILGFLSVPALLWVCRAKASRELAEVARLFAMLGLIWIFVTAIVLNNMQLLPRYYMVPAYCFALVVVLWVSQRAAAWRRIHLLVGIAIGLSVNFFAIYIDNKNPRFAERELAAYLAVSDGPVYADPLTAEDTEWFCRWLDVDCSRVQVSPPPPGSLYFYNAKNVAGSNRKLTNSEIVAYRPTPTWSVVWQKAESPRLIGKLLKELRFDSWLPAGIFARLYQPNGAVLVYRVGQCGDTGLSLPRAANAC